MERKKINIIKNSNKKKKIAEIPQSLSNCNWTRTHYHLFHKRTLSLNGWEFLYKLNGCGFESSYSHLNFRFHACFEQGVPWHSGNYRVWIHSCTWHDKNMQSPKFVYITADSSIIYLDYIFCIVFYCPLLWWLIFWNPHFELFIMIFKGPQWK